MTTPAPIRARAGDPPVIRLREEIIPRPQPSQPRHRRRRRRRRGGPVRLRLWIPLSALWVILSPFALLLAPVAAAGMTSSSRGRQALTRLGGNPLALVGHVGGLLFALSGTVVEVEAPDASIHITIV